MQGHGGMVQITQARYNTWLAGITALGYGLNRNMVHVSIRNLPPRNEAPNRVEVSVRMNQQVPAPPEAVAQLLALSLRLAIHDTILGEPSLAAQLSVGGGGTDTRAAVVLPGTDHALESWPAISGAHILNALENVLKSRDNVTIFDIDISAALAYVVDEALAQDIEGFGRVRARGVVPSNGTFCGCQALVAGLQQLEKGKSASLLQPRGDSARHTKAQELYGKLGLQDTIKGGMVIGDFERFTELYPDHRVLVWTDQYGGIVSDYREFRGRDFEMPAGEEKGERMGKTISILFSVGDEHFDLLLPHNVKALRSNVRSDRIRWCGDCLKAFKHTTKKQKLEWLKHECGGRKKCPGCFVGFRVPDLAKHLKDAVLCPNGCGVMLGKGDCEMLHALANEKLKESPCKGAARICEKCTRLHAPDSPCAPITCYGCSKKMDKSEVFDHRCYMKPLSGKQKGSVDEEGTDESEVFDRARCWSADIEVAFRKLAKPPAVIKGDHSIDKGELFEHIPVMIGCWNFGALDSPPQTWTVKSCGDPIREFLNFFIKPVGWAKATAKHLVFFHNGGRYDIRILYNYIMRHMDPAIIRSTVMDGSTIKKLDCGTVVFLDSYMHLSQPLAKLPALFGLDIEAISREYNVPFRKGHFPYTFFTEDQIDYEGELPGLEWFQSDRKSGKVLKELEEWHAAERAKGPWNLWRALEEYFVPDLLIPAVVMQKYSDLSIEAGFTDPLGTITLPSNCMKTFRRHHLEKETFPLLRYFPKLADPGSRQYSGANEEKVCRDAYVGGRTQNCALYHKLSEEELAAGSRIKFLDVNSMYPSVMVNHRYPAKGYEFVVYGEGLQPTVEELGEMEGFACMEIEPTRAVMFPILHRKLDGKLQFPLMPCLSAEEAVHFTDHHTFREPGDKFLCGVGCGMCPKLWWHERRVYTMPEIRYALELGYRIRHVYFILQAQGSTTTLFNSYYASSYGTKCKYAASPHLDWSDPAVCEWYVREMKEKAGIEIPVEFHGRPQDWHTPNGGLKTLGKLTANSFYGKLGSKSNPMEMTVAGIDSWLEDAIMRGSKGEVRGAVETLAGTMFKTRNMERPSPGYGTTNVGHAAYVTAYARIKLTRIMNDIHDRGGRVLYCDTDSVIAVFPPGVAMPATGPFLGDLGDEAEDDELVEFVGLLPKTYSVKAKSGKVVKMRFKGVSMGDARNMEIITFDWMVEAAGKMMRARYNKESKTCTEVHKDDWVWDQKELRMTTQTSRKVAQVDWSMLKGDLAADGTLYPAGAARFEEWEDVDWASDKLNIYTHDELEAMQVD